MPAYESKMKMCLGLRLEKCLHKELAVKSLSMRRVDMQSPVSSSSDSPRQAHVCVAGVD